MCENDAMIYQHISLCGIVNFSKTGLPKTKTEKGSLNMLWNCIEIRKSDSIKAVTFLPVNIDGNHSKKQKLLFYLVQNLVNYHL